MTFTLTHADRQAIKQWASKKFPDLVRSVNGEVLWGRGGQCRTKMSQWGMKAWLNAGVRMVGERLVVENSRKQLIADIPLSAAAVEVVAQMGPPDWRRWTITDGVGLLAYCDWLTEHDEYRWAARVRRWAELATQDSALVA